MDGRGNVDLDGDRGASDRPAGRPDQQGVQEMIVRLRSAWDVDE